MPEALVWDTTDTQEATTNLDGDLRPLLIRLLTYSLMTHAAEILRFGFYSTRDRVLGQPSQPTHVCIVWASIRSNHIN